MAEKKATDVKKEQTAQTKYDRKMAERRKKAAQDQKEDKQFKIISAIVGIVVVAAIAFGIIFSVMAKQDALNGTYVKVGDRKVPQVEFDYYYHMTVNSYLASYSSLLPYLGLDTTLDYADQMYSDELTWEDKFKEMTMEQMTRTYALADDAKKAGFEYDVETAFNEWTADLENSSKTAGVSQSDYVKTLYGKYATVNNIAPFIKEGLLAVVYNSELRTKNVPAAEEITAYYEAHKDDYDKVDYRSFTFDAQVGAEAGEEEIAKAMADAKEKADAFMQARIEGSDFETLCIENATEENKADYEDAATEHSLSEGRFNTSVPSAAREWMYDDARAEGDIAVIEDAENHRYYVMEFLNKYYDEASNETISGQLSDEKTEAYIADLLTAYPVEDVKAELKYLTVAEK